MTPTDAEGMVIASLALGQLDEAAAELRAVRDRLATALYAVEVDRHWLVPRQHRPTCPLDGEPCTSWTCLVDVCVDGKKEG
jgi:hypothetical protein